MSMMCVCCTHSSYLCADGLFSVNVCVRESATQAAGNSSDSQFETEPIHSLLL